jgi:hypothetical protein
LVIVKLCDDEILANSIEQNAQQKGKRRNKEDPNLSQHSKTQSRSLRGKGTYHVSKAPPITRNISEREG